MYTPEVRGGIWFARSYCHLTKTMRGGLAWPGTRWWWVVGSLRSKMPAGFLLLLLPEGLLLCGHTKNRGSFRVTVQRKDNEALPASKKRHQQDSERKVHSWDFGSAHGEGIQSQGSRLAARGHLFPRSLCSCGSLYPVAHQDTREIGLPCVVI
jgi:hypothetical protein